MDLPLEVHKTYADPENADHYIGIDVGTSSARACVMNINGDIVGLASHEIGLWQPEHGHYEQSTADIWKSVCIAVRGAMSESKINPDKVRGIGFDATCSLAVFNHETNEPVSVTGHGFDSECNVILWLDHRPVGETVKINSTKHTLLEYVGGSMSPEMEIPKVLWLKNHMPKELFDKCSFYDLVDALTHIATGDEKQRICSEGIKKGFVPVGADGTVKGWHSDFLRDIGLSELATDNFKRVGGVDKNGDYLSAGELIGHLGEAAALDLGLPAGIAIGSGVIDAYAGWIGTVGAGTELGPDEISMCAPKNDEQQTFCRLAVVAGTSTCHLLMSLDFVPIEGIWGPFSDTIIPGYCMAEGGQSATGELIRHLIHRHPAFEEAAINATARQMNIYDYLNTHLEEMREAKQVPCIAYLARHFFCYGDLWGNRSPLGDPKMTGSIVGLTNDDSVDALAIQYFATMEFIALQTYQIVEKMIDAGHDITVLFMSGSQCYNGFLVTLIATACEMPVIIPKYANAAVCHGAAMLGAKAASADEHGHTTDLWPIMNQMSKSGRKVMPTEDKLATAILQTKYDILLEDIKRQKKYRKMINDTVHDNVGKFWV